MRSRMIVLVIVAAVLLRIGYSFAMLEFGGSFHNGNDSGKYVGIAEALVATGEFAYINDEVDPPVVTPATDRMPLYPYFIAGMMIAFGDDAFTAIAMSQALIDGLTIALLALAAAAIDRRLAVPTAIFAAIAPNLIVHASYVLTETPFLFFFSAALAALLWSLRARRAMPLLVLAGIALGLALLTRPVMMFFPLFLLPTLAYAIPAARKVSFGRGVLLATIPVLIMVAFAVPRMVEHQARFGHATLTTQSGNHLLKWVYPCLNTPWSCASHGSDWEINKPLVDARLAELPPEEAANPAVRNDVFQSVAVERILELGVVKIAIGASIGAFKNLIQTGFYETLTQFRQPATFFSAMSGETIGARIGSFLETNRGNVFMMLWFLAQAGLFLARAVQLVGLGSGLADARTRPFTVLIAATIAYFLAVNGPIGNPKYRIPTEPGLFILLSMGCYSLVDWFRGRRARAGSNATVSTP